MKKIIQRTRDKLIDVDFNANGLTLSQVGFDVNVSISDVKKYMTFDFRNQQKIGFYESIKYIPKYDEKGKKIGMKKNQEFFFSHDSWVIELSESERDFIVGLIHNQKLFQRNKCEDIKAECNNQSFMLSLSNTNIKVPFTIAKKFQDYNPISQDGLYFKTANLTPIDINITDGCKQKYKYYFSYKSLHIEISRIELSLICSVISQISAEQFYFKLSNN